MTLVHNERTKLLANALDRTSTACLTVGVLGPAAATLYNLGGTTGRSHDMLLIAGSLAWLVATTALHLLARRVLGGLK